jgi:hypothetical protein
MMTGQYPRSPSDRTLRNLTSLRLSFNYWINPHGLEWVVTIPNQFNYPAILAAISGVRLSHYAVEGWRIGIRSWQLRNYGAHACGFAWQD